MTPMRRCVWISLRRKVTKEDIDTLDLDVMPGFELTWHYTKHVENNPKYTDENKDFIRYTKDDNDNTEPKLASRLRITCFFQINKIDF